MSRVSFTPGPWYVAGVDRNNGSIDIKHKFDSSPLECFIAEVIGGLKEQDANARLIASAPDLLAALQGVVRVADRNTDEFNAARAAIAKAKGLDQAKEQQ